MIDVKFSKEIPDVYKELNEKFGVKWNDGIIICYGNTIHCKQDISPDKLVHETIHVKQQEKIGKDEWWRMYIDIQSFRLEQEIEAYRAEYQFIKRNIKNREAVFKFLTRMAKDLSSSIYGDIITTDEAIKLICQSK